MEEYQNAGWLETILILMVIIPIAIAGAVVFALGYTISIIVKILIESGKHLCIPFKK